VSIILIRRRSTACRDPPAMNWSVLRYAFGLDEEDHESEEMSQTREGSREAESV
jgi:hypothetical protein